jgi:hypothetical protein
MIPRRQPPEAVSTVWSPCPSFRRRWTPATPGHAQPSRTDDNPVLDTLGVDNAISSLPDDAVVHVQSDVDRRPTGRYAVERARRRRR